MQCYSCSMDTWNPSEDRDAKAFGKKKSQIKTLETDFEYNLLSSSP